MSQNIVMFMLNLFILNAVSYKNVGITTGLYIILIAAVMTVTEPRKSLRLPFHVTAFRTKYIKLVRDEVATEVEARLLVFGLGFRKCGRFPRAPAHAVRLLGSSSLAQM